MDWVLLVLPVLVRPPVMPPLPPLKGTPDYEDKKHLLTASDPEKFDFLHLVMPSRLPKWIFYGLFYTGHLRLLKSRRIRNMIRELIFKAKED